MFLCIDCGLTNGKLLLLDTQGTCLGEISFPTPLDRGLVHTHVLRERLFGAVRKLLADSGADPKAIRSISVSGHGNGLYTLGEQDVLPLGYSSMVTESGAFLPPPGETFPIILQSDWAGQPLPILAWLKNTRPEVYGAIRQVLFCKDLLRWFLTGSCCTEPTDASAAGLLNGRTGAYDRSLLALYGLEDAKLPPMVRSDGIAGRVSAAAAEKTGLAVGTPVLGGLFDVNSCMLGTGVVRQGTYALIAGTWGINAAPCAQLAQTDVITQCCRFYGAEPFVCIDSAPTSCSNLEWFTKQVLDGIPFDRANALVEAQPTDEGLIYLPYLYPPMDMPGAQGAFVGLQPHHTRADMLRAVYEGIVFEHRYRLEKLRLAGVRADKAVLSGGAANSPVFAKMFADICALKIRTPVQTQAGALGGAILGLVASGEYESPEAAAAALVRYRPETQPEPREYYERKYLRFREMQRKFT